MGVKMEKNVIIVLLLVLLVYYLSGKKKERLTFSQDNIVIYIDPGHGGLDGGASFNGVHEKDVVLEISFYLKSLFEANGFKCYLTRTGDYDLAPEISQNRKRDDLRVRAKLINESDADIYLSIHANSFTSPKIYGSQTFYQADNLESRKLATYILDSIKENLKNTKRYPLAITDKFLIDNVNKIGCFVEVGYLSNPNELQLLTNPEYQMKMAAAIYFGVLEYFNNRHL